MPFLQAQCYELLVYICCKKVLCVHEVLAIINKKRATTASLFMNNNWSTRAMCSKSIELHSLTSSPLSNENAWVVIFIIDQGRFLNVPRICL